MNGNGDVEPKRICSSGMDVGGKSEEGNGAEDVGSRSSECPNGNNECDSKL